MPLVDAVAPLPVRPRRILVAGTSGAGKTTVARRVANLLDIPHIEIDALFHGPGWTPLDTFESEVRSFSGRSCWVTEWQYSRVRPLLAQRADHKTALRIATLLEQYPDLVVVRLANRSDIERWFADPFQKSPVPWLGLPLVRVADMITTTDTTTPGRLNHVVTGRWLRPRMTNSGRCWGWPANSRVGRRWRSASRMAWASMRARGAPRQ